MQIDAVDVISAPAALNLGEMRLCQIRDRVLFPGCRRDTQTGDVVTKVPAIKPQPTH